VVLVALVAVLAALASRGVYARYPRRALLTRDGQLRAPAWTAPCWPTAPWTDKAVCAHVRGRVFWIEKRDADGDADRHLLVIDRFHTRIVKLTQRLGVAHLPRIGARIDAVGWLMSGVSGRTELNAQRLRAGSRSWSTQTG
jgi:hypothetical protein